MHRKKFLLLIYGLLGALAGYIFISKLFCVLIFSGLALYLAKRRYRQELINEEVERERLEFQYLLENFSSSIESGRNVIDALIIANDDMGQVFSTEKNEIASLRKRLSDFFSEQKSGQFLAEGLEKLSLSCKDKMTASFFSRLEPAIRQGADLTAFSRSYYRLLLDEEKLRAERKARLDAAKREQTLLFAMPFLLLAVMRASGIVTDEYKMIDYLARAIALICFYIAFLWSKAILNE